MTAEGNALPAGYATRLASARGALFEIERPAFRSKAGGALRRLAGGFFGSLSKMLAGYSGKFIFYINYNIHMQLAPNRQNPHARKKIADVLGTPLGKYADAVHRILSLKASKFWELGFGHRRRFVEDAVRMYGLEPIVGAAPLEARYASKKIAGAYDDHKRIVEAGARNKAVLLHKEGAWGGGMPESKIRIAMLADAIRPAQEGVFETINGDVISLWDGIRISAAPYEWTARLMDKDKGCGYSFYFSLGIFEKYAPRLAFMDKLDLGQLDEYCGYVDKLRRQIDGAYFMAEADGLSGSDDYGRKCHNTLQAVRASKLFGEISGFFGKLGIGLGVFENMLYDEMKLKMALPFIFEAKRIWNAPFPAEEK